MLPIGTFSDYAGVGVGALLGLNHRLTDRLDLTGRVGFVYHFSKDYNALGSHGLSEVPILAGVRYTFLPSAAGGLYGSGELGLSLLVQRATVSAGLLSKEPVSTSDSTVKLSMALGAGYAYENFDLRGSLLMLDVGNLDTTIGLMATVGYSFAGF